MGKYRKIDKTCPDIRCEQSRASQQQHLYVCVNLWLFKNISIQNLLFFFMFVIQRQFHLTTEVLFLGGKNNLIYEFFLPFRNLHRVVIGTNTVHFLCATRCFKVVSSSRSLSSPFIAQMFDIPWSLHSQVYFQLPEPIAFFNACFAAPLENFYFHHPNIPMIFASKMALDSH